MSYDEPLEWQGRGPRSRDGWPNSSVNPGAPRSHRRPGDERVELARDDTGEFRPSRAAYHEEMPTDPAIRAPGARRTLLVPAEPAPVEHVILPIPQIDDPVARFDLWLRVAVHLLAIVALIAALWCLGMVIADGGVPLWVPSR